MAGADQVGSVVKCCEESAGSDVYRLEVELNGGFPSVPEPGQFAVLEPLARDSVMPRPFSVADYTRHRMTFFIKAIGKNTVAYADLQPGALLRLSGPHGRPIPLDLERKYILVGGGMGGAALVYACKRLARLGKKPTVLLGGEKTRDIIGLGDFRSYGGRVRTITEAGDGERIGVVTSLLEEELEQDDGESVVIACGPKQMLESVSRKRALYGNSCQVVLEEVMACGIGSCKGCAVFGRNGTQKHVCRDGPAFDADWLDWIRFTAPLRIEKIATRIPARVETGVNLNGLDLDYPAMNASGCLDVDAIEREEFDISCLGALVTKGLTLEPKAGNAMPRICETTGGMLNSIGLENEGLQGFLNGKLSRWFKPGKPVIVNIAGFSMGEYEQLARKLGETGIAGLEINISCPNVKHGIAFGADPGLANSVTRVVRQAAPDKFIMVKLTPSVGDIAAIAKSVVDGGADAVSLVNTFPALAIDPYTMRPRIANGTAGLSGPAIKPIAVRMVRQVYEARLNVPIVGMGGITNGRDAAEFMLAGADAIAAGTGGFADRGLFANIIEDLQAIARRHGYPSISKLTGSLLM